MKRLVILFTLLLISTQMIGCGGDSTPTSSPAADNTTAGEDGKDKAKRLTDMEDAVAKKAAAKKSR
jgi:hypothetical protein